MPSEFPACGLVGLRKAPPGSPHEGTKVEAMGQNCPYYLRTAGLYTIHVGHFQTRSGTSDLRRINTHAD